MFQNKKQNPQSCQTDVSGCAAKIKTDGNK